MPLLLLTVSYLILATTSNVATMYLSYSGPNYLLTFAGIAVKLLEYYIVFVVGLRHINPKAVLFFKGYWVLLAGTAVTNLLLQGQLNYLINILNLLCYLILMALLILAPVGGKLLKFYGAAKILLLLYSGNLFVNALIGTTGNVSAIIIILFLSFFCDCLLVAVVYWSRQFISTPVFKTKQRQTHDIKLDH